MPMIKTIKQVDFPPNLMLYDATRFITNLGQIFKHEGGDNNITIGAGRHLTSS